jgi:hypothetical protein
LRLISKSQIMKTRLIHKYFELREARQWSMVTDSSGLTNSLMAVHMMRIDLILYRRYGLDLSLIPKLN